MTSLGRTRLGLYRTRARVNRATMVIHTHARCLPRELLLPAVSMASVVQTGYTHSAMGNRSPIY